MQKDETHKKQNRSTIATHKEHTLDHLITPIERCTIARALDENK